MKKGLLSILLLWIAIAVTAQEKKLAAYSVAFYNLENLFDTIPGSNDTEYTPNGPNKWDTFKYNAKLQKMAFALDQLAMEKCPIGPAVIGLAEIENTMVLEDLVKTGNFAKKNMQVVHYDGPDPRGVDCALLYNPKLFAYEGSESRAVIDKQEPRFKTRDQLIVRGRIAGELFHIIVVHWPSRRGGEERSRPKREMCARATRSFIDSIQQVAPESRIVVMGDFNDDPFNIPIKETLNAKKKQEQVKPGGLYNPFWQILDKGIGTLAYQGKWNLFDQIIVSENLLGKDRTTLKYWQAEVFNRDFLKNQEGLYKGYPLRTHAGGVWMNGYSDHFPSIVYFLKEVN